MKHLVILGDGMADWPVPELDNRTLLQYADTPALNRIAREGRCGMLKTVQDGFHPGSEVANSSILGYDQRIVYEGRGPLEAASIGVSLSDDDLALRCNLVCIEGDVLKNHSCGRFGTKEGDELIHLLQDKLGSDSIHFYTGVQYRHLLVIKGGDKRVACTPPHDIPGQRFEPFLPHAEVPEAEPTAELLRNLIRRSQELLPHTSLNKSRSARGADTAGSIWPWGGGYCPRMQTLMQRFPQIRSGVVITAVDLIRGIGRYAGLEVMDVPGATGLYDTDFDGKAQAAIEALRKHDFVYLHVEAADEAGHDGDLNLKLQCIRDLDHRLVKPILDELDTWDEPVCVAVLPDHPTPVAHRTHTAEPVPFAIWHRGIIPDRVLTFDEVACRDGIYGTFERDGFINEFMQL